MPKYNVKITRVTDYVVTAKNEEEAIELALEGDPKAEAQGGEDRGVATVWYVEKAS